MQHKRKLFDSIKQNRIKQNEDFKQRSNLLKVQSATNKGEKMLEILENKKLKAEQIRIRRSETERKLRHAAL